MGLRYILLGLAMWGGYLIVRHLARQRKQQQGGQRPLAKSVDSVQCARCGLHLPREEALRRGDRYYCCQAHLDAPDSDADSADGT